MKSNGKLSLHEAIVVALINIDKSTFAATFKEIADYIDLRGLFDHADNNISLEEQVKLRTTQSKKRYKYLFQQIDKDSVQLLLDYNS